MLILKLKSKQTFSIYSEFVTYLLIIRKYIMYFQLLSIKNRINELIIKLMICRNNYTEQKYGYA